MLQLIYSSIASGSMSDADVASLCVGSSVSNARDEITGILLYRAGYVLQVLEGPREAVENTFMRIIVDDRHHSLMLLGRRMATRREFGEWAMAKYDDPSEQRAIIDRVRERITGAAAHVRDTFERQFGRVPHIIETPWATSTGQPLNERR